MRRHEVTEAIPPEVAHHRATLDRLVRQRGLRRFAYFGTTGEGIPLPDGLEVTTGYVLDGQGRVFRFTLGADPTSGAPVLTRWVEVEPRGRLAESEGYRRARGKVGLG